MEVFVILALALGVLTVGMVVVAVVVLRRAMQSLRVAAEDMRGRLEPLGEELQAEAAVTTLELEAVQRRADRGGKGDSHRRLA